MSDGPSDAYKHHYPKGCIVDHSKPLITNSCDECGLSTPIMTYQSTGLSDPAYRKICSDCLNTQEYYDKDGDCSECDERPIMAGDLFTVPGKSELTEGTKYDSGKVPLELLPTQALEEVARVLDFGQKKYASWNWAKGFKWTRLIGAAIRHIYAYQRGEDKDPESGLSHLSHAACCILFLLQHEISNLGEDDRYKGFIKK